MYIVNAYYCQNTVPGILGAVEKRTKHGLFPQILYNSVICEFLLVIKFGKNNRSMGSNTIKQHLYYNIYVLTRMQAKCTAVEHSVQCKKAVILHMSSSVRSPLPYLHFRKGPHILYAQLLFGVSFSCIAVLLLHSLKFGASGWIYHVVFILSSSRPTPGLAGAGNLWDCIC